MQDAFDSLAEHGYRHIPVVDDGKLVGVVSLRDIVRHAQIQPVVHPSLVEAPAGLKGVIVAETSVGDVRGTEGFYHYRQYNAVELAEKKRLEDVWYLLFEGRLPSRAEREAFLDEIRPLRQIPAPVLEVLPQIARSSSSVMEGLRTAVSLVGAVSGFKPTLDISAPSAGRTRCRSARWCRRSSWRCTATATASSRSRRATTSATAPTTCGCSAARRPTPTRDEPSSSTRSPPSTTASTRRRSPRG